MQSAQHIPALLFFLVLLGVAHFELGVEASVACCGGYVLGFASAKMRDLAQKQRSKS